MRSRAPTIPQPPRGERLLVRAAWVFWLVGLGWVAANASGSLGSISPWAMPAVALASIVAFGIGILCNQPEPAWPWLALLWGFGGVAGGAMLRVHLHTFGNLGPSRSLIPDAVSLPGYLLLGAGIYGLARARRLGGERAIGVVLDGAMAALAVFAAGWVYLLDPGLFHHNVTLAPRLLVDSYPPLSVFLLVVVIRIAFGPAERRSHGYWFLLSAFGFLFVGNVGYTLAEVHRIQLSSGLLDLPYGIAYVAAGTCVLQPSMRKLASASRAPWKTLSRARAALVALSLVFPSVLMLTTRLQTFADRVVLFSVVLGLTAAAVLRILQALFTAERSELRLTYQALHDSLTGLPNRRMLQQHLAETLAKAHVDETHVAVLFLDLDQFKLVNDSMGHTHGDELLVNVAQRLRQFVRPTDLVTRVGGDEFMVVLGDVLSVSQALELANRLRLALQQPFWIAGSEFHVSVSIGLAFATGDDATVDAELLIRDADTAMYQAKEAGRNAVAVFDESMRNRVFERVELENDLRHAIARNELFVQYQPVIRRTDGVVVGFEALVRWAHPTFGLLLPDKFIPLAEESGLIIDIGRWVLREAMAQLSLWRRELSLTSTTVAVNLSALQLHDEGLVGEVGSLLAEYGLPGSALCLELTESMVMDDPEAAIVVLEALRRLGVTLAIDDFGTQYSSLAYLHRFPVDSLKIDRSFVSTLHDPDSSSDTLVAAIVAMADALRLETVAEGVETALQARALSALGCNYLQGFLYSRPVRSEQVPHLLRLLGARLEGQDDSGLAGSEQGSDIEEIGGADGGTAKIGDPRGGAFPSTRVRDAADNSALVLAAGRDDATTVTGAPIDTLAGMAEAT